MSDVCIRFEYGQQDRMGDSLGPFDFIQATYSAIRVGANGDNADREIARLVDGLWVTEDGQKWSDFVIFAAAASAGDAAIAACREILYERAARAQGWERGGDNGGIVFHMPTWGSWKAAASWSGEDGKEPAGKPTIYSNWRECCEGQDIDLQDPIDG